MIPIVLFDHIEWRNQFYPFSVNRSVADLRFGIFTQQERWRKFAGQPVYIQTIESLSNLYTSLPLNNPSWFVAANVLPNTNLLNALSNLQLGNVIQSNHQLIAFYGYYHDFEKVIQQKIKAPISSYTITNSLQIIQTSTDLFLMNAAIIASDIALVRSLQTTINIDDSNRIDHVDAVFVAPGAMVKHAIINTSEGPVYIGENALVMEGALLRGPIAVGEGAVIKMGATIYGATTIGKRSVAGGEIKNSIIMDFSNKAHHGYLGDSVVGNWCNIGAGTSNSNIKNSGAPVAVWNDLTKSYGATLQKCGVLMGDYTRVAINTSINTASVMGICCNVFGSGLLPRHLPHFSWGIEKKYHFLQAVHDIIQWKSFKNSTLSNHEMNVLQHIFEQSEI
ncbi:MAG: glucose-1-phosphate thymidylyltransferase [Bacteroidota bacterium]|jgi:UDP-N-acetylglucosamine diphosphorylase/glucosamine-1-phosphate N-acetyltransferase|nr:glucose-1-phosphate thymidylyltransferase [Bacteroidota bacterium]